MSNVIPFSRKPKAGIPDGIPTGIPGTIDGSTARRLKALSRGGFADVVRPLGWIAFLLLLWLRLPLRFFLMLTATCGWVALPLVCFGLPAGDPRKTVLALAAAGIGFSSFAIAYLYDAMLERVAP
ncbi:hypothetical protein AWB68_07491 [Caballeronia choica]|uniref:Uncharacterized protein n=1 Tax=Caballeronia choica TaxID=326476 RepID=A0A158KW16_9BURK|nr:hypothetical protein [Caballeronia choica]SAL84909.1 hypothetical protein AWB68_07491 [Caballeronia choica]